MLFNPSDFPFSCLSNVELFDHFSYQPYKANNVDLDLKKILSDTLADDVIDTFESNYYTPCQLNNLANRYRNNSMLSMFHVNVRSLNANYNKLITFLQVLTFNFDVIILSEIWSTNLTYYTNLLNGYDFFFDLPGNRAGGVGIYVKRSLNAIQTTKYNSPSSNLRPRYYESVWIEICVEKRTSIIGGFYRHPNSPVKDFTDDFSYSLEKIKNIKYCYVFGDINICMSNYSHNNLTNAYVDAVLDSKFLPYVYMPTRITNHSSSIIDHVYSNNLFTDNNICKTGLIINDIADHCANFMFVIENNQLKCCNKSVDAVRIFSKHNINKFNNLLDHTDWSYIYRCTDTNVAYNYFADRLNNCHDACFPLVKPKKKFKVDKKWITPALIKSVNTKCKLYKKWIKSKKQKDEIKYKNYAKFLKRILKLAENQYYSKLFDSKINGIKSIWKNINLLINNKQSNFSDIKKLLRTALQLIIRLILLKISIIIFVKLVIDSLLTILLMQAKAIGLLTIIHILVNII